MSFLRVLASVLPCDGCFVGIKVKVTSALQVMLKDGLVLIKTCTKSGLICKQLSLTWFDNRSDKCVLGVGCI